MNLQIDIRPEVNILSVLQHLNYKPWFALAEFVDNSLGSFLAHQDRLPNSTLRVAIQFHDSPDGGSLSVSDNAAGIAAEDFPRAFRAADAPADRTGLSEFGMGMKSAASWFAERWGVSTTCLGEPVLRRVQFNIAAITADHVERLDVDEEYAESAEHFTVVRLDGLHHNPQKRTVGKIRSHLTSIYRRFLRSGRLELSYNGDLLSFQEVEILSAPRAGSSDGDPLKWRKELDFTLASGKRVTGFAGLRATGSTTEAGFALFRRDRLIVGSHDDPYRPAEIFGRSNSFVFQRLFGELNLDQFEVTHTKDGFRWDEDEEDLLANLKDALQEEPLNLIAQANDYRPSLNRRSIISIQQATDRVADQLQSQLEPLLVAALSNPIEPAVLPDIADAVPSRVDFDISRVVPIVVDNAQWEVELVASADPGTDQWLRVGATSAAASAGGLPHYQVQINLALEHPFSRRFLGPGNEGSELLLSVAAAIGLALAISRSEGAKAYSVLQHINDLTRKTLTAFKAGGGAS